MPVLDDAFNILLDVAESVGIDPAEFVDLLDGINDPNDVAVVATALIQANGEVVEPFVDLVDEGLLAEAEARGVLTPEDGEALTDDIQGVAAALVGGALAVAYTVETVSGGQIDSSNEKLFDLVALFNIDSVIGREVEATLQDGIDPALKQQVHRRHRSKQADFQDYVEGNLRSKGVAGDMPTRSGEIPQDLRDLLHPNDLDYLPDPDTYGTIPGQTGLFELAGIKVNEPEEIIEEPIQYGIPVPLRPVEQITELAGQPEDVKEIYKEVIRQLPKTENLIQDYVRLTEFNFRLREKVTRGVLTPSQARSLIEPELRELIVNALPDDRYRPEDRTASEVVDILAGELERNFQLLQSLPADPPTQGDLEAWFQKGVITSEQYSNLYSRFGSSAEAFGFYLEEQAIDEGWDGIQEHFALGRYGASEARLRLQLIGFSTQEASRILSGADGDTIITNRLIGEDEEAQLPASVATNIGDARQTQLDAVGLGTLSALADASVDEVASVTGMGDQQAQQAIQSAQTILSGQV